MILKGFSTFPRYPEVEPHMQMQFSIQTMVQLWWWSVGVLAPLQGIIIIILLCHQHGYPWLSLATSPYRSLLLAGPQDYIPYFHRTAVGRFELVALILLGHVRGPIGEHHLWASPCFSRSVLHVWLLYSIFKAPLKRWTIGFNK